MLQSSNLFYRPLNLRLGAHFEPAVVGHHPNPRKDSNLQGGETSAASQSLEQVARVTVDLADVEGFEISEADRVEDAHLDQGAAPEELETVDLEPDLDGLTVHLAAHEEHSEPFGRPGGNL